VTWAARCGFAFSLLWLPFEIAWDLFGPDNFDKAIAEQAAELQRLADNGQ
jgi:hypothetical protein